MIQDERDKDAINTIFAKEGRIIADETGQQVILRLTNGTIHRRDKKRGDYYIVSFEGYDLNLDFWGSISKKKFRMTRYEMSIKELSKRIKEEKERGEDYRELQVHLYSKFALPFVCIIFGIMGIPLGLKGKKSGKYLGIIISLVVVVFYYIIFSIAEVLGSRGNISPIVASWLPNILLAVFAIYIFLINAKEKESFLFNFIEYFFKRFERERDSK
ncbi:MAG: LptF/LptG family permease [Deltaproteobacteria bacterium]|nr:LptF/LptG family permease [Deltaproteobacteria bacterium]